MHLLKLRWLTAGVLAAVATLAAPARSTAATQILVEEIDGGGSIVPGSTMIFTGSVANYSTTNFSSINVNPTPNSGAISSLTTTASAIPVSGIDATHQLRVIVTSDGFANPNAGGSAVVSNNASASSGIGGGENILTNQTQLLNTPLSPGANQTGFPAAGSPLGAATAPATDTRPSTTVSPTTTSNISLMPSEFAIQQTIYIRANPTGSGGIATGSTLGGSASSFVSTTPAAAVPAPAGVVLALTALPVLGLRRVFRRKSAV